MTIPAAAAAEVATKWPEGPIAVAWGAKESLGAGPSLSDDFDLLLSMAGAGVGWWYPPVGARGVRKAGWNCDVIVG